MYFSKLESSSAYEVDGQPDPLFKALPGFTADHFASIVDKPVSAYHPTYDMSLPGVLSITYAEEPVRIPGLHISMKAHDLMRPSQKHNWSSADRNSIEMTGINSYAGQEIRLCWTAGEVFPDQHEAEYYLKYLQVLSYKGPIDKAKKDNGLELNFDEYFQPLTNYPITYSVPDGSTNLHFFDVRDEAPNPLCVVPAFLRVNKLNFADALDQARAEQEKQQQFRDTPRARERQADREDIMFHPNLKDEKKGRIRI